MARHRVAIVWLRRSLRLADNPALAFALDAAESVVVAYVPPAPDDPWAPGAASRAWRVHSLAALDAALRERDSGIIVRTGSPAAAISALAAECGATLVCFDRAYEPDSAVADARTCLSLDADGILARGFNCALVNEPAGPLTTGGGPFKVFTPYYNACLRLGEPDAPLPAPVRIPSPAALPASEPFPGGARHPIGVWWTPGEAGAMAAAKRFVAAALDRYPDDRDLPGIVGTSRLSPHLAFGEISPRQVVALLGSPVGPGAAAYLRQLYWREFAYHTLHHFPDTPERPLHAQFERMGWAEDPAGLAAWQEGHTGYPIVDAGMRELAATGWMHNRVRMIAASFLTKDLLLPWQAGARFFWEHLVDADLANNTFGWQWVAGSGADAAPYFRVFNPTLQGRRFDPSGAYVRTWVPELTAVPDAWIHRPWEAPAIVLEAAGVALGTTYPEPVIDHAEARIRALAAFGALKAR